MASAWVGATTSSAILGGSIGSHCGDFACSNLAVKKEKKKKKKSGGDVPYGGVQTSLLVALGSVLSSVFMGMVMTL